jgi:hypothetical protein
MDTQPASKERTATDFAIEHAEYMAVTAEHFIKLFNVLSLDGTPQPTVDAACEASRVLTDHIYEFRKRAERARIEPLADQTFAGRGADDAECGTAEWRRDNPEAASAQPPPDALAALSRAMDFYLTAHVGLTELTECVYAICGPSPTFERIKAANRQFDAASRPTKGEGQ